MLVVQLSDDNLDGNIDDTDIPDVLFLAENPAGQLLIALDGVTGSEIARSANYLGGNDRVPPAAADIDGDGIVEIVTFRNGGIAAFEHDLTLKWQSPENTDGFSIGIADLDQDGTPEIYTSTEVFSADGTLRWRSSERNGSQPQRRRRATWRKDPTTASSLAKSSSVIVRSWVRFQQRFQFCFRHVEALESRLHHVTSHSSSRKRRDSG